MNILLRIIPVILRGPNTEYLTYALFDKGSTSTFIYTNWIWLVKKKPLCIQIQDPTTLQKKFHFIISGMEQGSKTFKLNNVRTVNIFELPVQSIGIEQISKVWPYVKQINLQ